MAPIQPNDVSSSKLHFISPDRVVDELHPERHFTVNDIITLIAKLVSQLCMYLCRDRYIDERLL